MTDEICMVCGAEMRAYDIIDKDTGEKVSEEIACPDEWREEHTRAKT